MSIYPVNQAITYTAVAATQGTAGHSFNYAWAFDDSTTASTASTNKTWTTTGNHLATVTATDTTTNSIATDSKLIMVGNYTWSLTGTTYPIYLRAPISGNITDNLVLHAGGINVGGAKLKTCYTFDGTTWTQTGDMVNPRTSFNNDAPTKTVKLPNGKILVAGNNGTDAGVGITSELYDPDFGTWALTGNMSYDRSFKCHPILLNDGRVLVYGGQNISASATNRYDFYDYTTGVWTLGGTQGITTDGIIAPPIMMNDGRVFFISIATGKCQIFDPSDDSWTTTTTSTLTNNINAPGVIGVCGIDDNVYIFGYNYVDGTLCGRYNTALNTWTQLTPYTSTLISKVMGGRIGGGNYILIVGVTTTGNQGSVIYDTSADSWIIPANFINQAQSAFSAAYDAGFGRLAGKVVVWSSDTSAPFGTAEIYDGG